MAGLVGPWISRWQGGDILLTSRIQDLNVDGYAGGIEGTGAFLAPSRGRIVQISCVSDDLFTNDLLKMRFKRFPDDVTSRETEAIIGATSGFGGSWVMDFEDTDPATQCEKGDVIRLEGNGGPTSTTGRATAYVVFRPEMDGAFLASPYVISFMNALGSAPFGFHYPVPVDLEVLELQVGAAQATTAELKFDIDKITNNETIVSVTVAADAAPGGYATSGRTLAANRFLRPFENIRVGVDVGDPGNTAMYPFNIICRRL